MILFSNECWFHLSHANGCERVNQRRGQRFADACIIEQDRIRGGSVLVWGGIMGGNKTCLIVINGIINAQTNINDVLAVEALLFIQFLGPNVSVMHDNACQHSAAITRQFLATNKVNVLAWPVNSPNLNPIEQVWDKLARHVRRNHAKHTVNDLAVALKAEWSNQPEPYIQHYVSQCAMHKMVDTCDTYTFH